MPSGGAIFGETDTMIAAKTAAAFRNRLTPILCVGEAVRSNPAGGGQTLPGAVRRSAAGGSGPPRDRCRRLRTALGDRRRETGVPGVRSENLRGDSRSPATRSPTSPTAESSTAAAPDPACSPSSNDSVDGLFLGRFAHDPSALEHILDRSARRQRNDADRRSASQRGEVTMAIGLSTYAFFWRISERVEHPLTLHEMLEQHRTTAAAQCCRSATTHRWRRMSRRGTGCSR